MMKNVAVAILIIAAVCVVLWLSYDKNAASPEGGVATSTKTMPATNVSKPAPTPAATSGTVTVKTGYAQKVAALGISITPKEITEDSRCPSDAQCVWAGTLKMLVRIATSTGASDEFLELGKPFTAGSAIITLVNVTPQPKINQPIGSNRYQFTFEIKKR